MSNAVEDLRKEIEALIKEHGFHPDKVDCKEYPPSPVGEKIVDYTVYLPSTEREDYANDHFDSDRKDVKKRGKELGLTARLYYE
ncbi:MAG TPA: hypothetical protein ACFYD3_00075 [Candidatus Hypogeohydataceae bacterium YC41]